MSTHMQPSQMYKRCMLLMLALAVCLMPLLSVQAEAAPATNAVSFGPYGVVNLRAAASANAAILAKLPNGTRLDVQWTLDGWAYVQFGTAKGYVAAHLVHPDQAAPIGTAFVYTQKGSNLNVRYAASETAKLLGKLPFGAQVNVLEQRGSWTLVQSGKLCGYVASRFLSTESKPAPATPDPAPSAKIGVIANLRTGRSVNLRAEASLNARIIGNLYNGQQVEILGQSGDFYKVNALNKVGYIARAYVSTVLVPIAVPTPPIAVEPEAPTQEQPIPTETDGLVPPMSE